MFERLLLVKTAWSDDYHHGEVSGDFAHVLAAGDGSERFNFTALGGWFLGYSTGKQSPHEHGNPPTPRSDAHGWTVVFVARHPKGGIYIVGWYENATLTGEYLPRPLPMVLQQLIASEEGESIYCIAAQTAYLVSLQDRTLNVSNGRFKSSGFYWLRGNGIDEEWTEDARLIAKEVSRLRDGLAKLSTIGGSSAIDVTSAETAGAREQDGKATGRGGGESDEHRRLRLWATNNPLLIVTDLPADTLTATEYPLPSGDRVDAAYLSSKQAWMVEVKSRISSDDDHMRGVYQCIKYREVYHAKHRGKVAVHSILVTERPVCAAVRELLAYHKVGHVLTRNAS